MDYTFYSTFPGTRPVYSSETTRAFAWDSLHAKYGRETELTPSVSMDEVEGFGDMAVYPKYDAMIAKIASEAPLRFVENELLCGSATLGDAVKHLIPATFRGQTVMGGISHLTSGFERLLREGLDSYDERIGRRMKNESDGEKLTFLRSLQNVTASIRVYHRRYMDALEAKFEEADGDRREYYSSLIENLRDVPFKAPRSFREAVQSLWFTFSFLRLCGCWPGIGRLDVMLGRFLDEDLRSGAITEDFAYELLAHFFIKGCEWIRLDSRGSGDAQHYQNIVLGGVDSDGNSVVNRVTYLTLKVVEEFPISDFPIALRVNDDTPDELIRLIARVMRHGSGVAAVYNDRLIIDSLVEFGYPVKEARVFANDGCWEVQIPGKTAFIYCPYDMYPLLENNVLNLRGESCPDYKDFGELYAALVKAMEAQLDGWQRWADTYAKEPYNPKSLVALFCDDCIENAADYLNRGARYSAVSFHFGGVPDVGNCLWAIKKNVYDDKRYTLPELREMLIENWAGHEEERRAARYGLTYYGNDNDGPDSIVASLMDDYMTILRRVKYREGVLRPAGISTFGRQIEWAPSRLAGADGFFAGEILSSNLCPTPGTDISGATAVIKSHCKAGLSRLSCGTALELKLDPSSVRGEAGINAVAGLIRSFVRLGGFFMQIDVLDNAVLLEAQKHPEDYPNLSVRISGWSARFVTLDDRWQQMIIERSTQK